MTFASGPVLERLMQKGNVSVAVGADVMVLNEGRRNPFQSGRVIDVEHRRGELPVEGELIYMTFVLPDNARHLLFHQLLAEPSKVGERMDTFLAYRLGRFVGEERVALLLFFTDASAYRKSNDFMFLEAFVQEAIRGGGRAISKRYRLTRSVFHSSDNETDEL